MADYLNPDSLLTPLGTNSMYAPTYMDMLTSDVERRLQAQEALRNANFMAEQDRRAKPWQTEAAISKAKLESDRDLSMADPAMVEAWKQGQVGEYQQNQAKGREAMGTVDSRIGLANAINNTGLSQTKLYDQYYKLQKLYEPLQLMVNSGMSPDMIKGNIMRLVKQNSGESDWMKPENMQALQLLASDPQRLLTVLDMQMGTIMDQAQRFDLTKIREKGQWDLLGEEARGTTQKGISKEQRESEANQKRLTAIQTRISDLEGKRRYYTGIVTVNPQTGEKVEHLKNDAELGRIDAEISALKKAYKAVAEKAGEPNVYEDITGGWSATRTQ